MDLDFESINSEGSPAQPFIYPMTNVVKSMEATEKIHDRTLRDGITNLSKPQADRALPNALKYGIFEMRKNQPEIMDKFLDDVDTIYWQSRTKHEETPYRFNNNCDYINPEKDRHTFRKFIVTDEEKNTSNRNVKAVLKETKERNRNTLAQKMPRHCRINKNYKRNKNQKANSKLNGKKQGRLNKQKRIPQPRRSCKERQKKLYTRKAQIKNNKIKNNSKLRTPKKFLNKKIYVEKFITTTGDSKSQRPPRRKDVLIDSEYDDDEDINYQDENEDLYIYDCNDVEKKDDFHELSNDEDNDDGCMCEYSAYVPYHLHECSDRYQAQYLKYFQKSSKGSAKENDNSAEKINESRSRTHFTEHLKPTESKYQNNHEIEYWCPIQEVSSNYNIYNMKQVKNGVRYWDSKNNCLRNKLNNAQEKSIKQCDNTLKIEPLDSLSYKNLEKTSYIS